MDKALLLKRLAQYDKMKASHKKYNAKRWEQMKLARAMRDDLVNGDESATQPQQ